MMHGQHEKRSGTERRHYDLVSLTYVEVERRSREDRRASQSVDSGDEPKNTLADALLIAKTKKTRDKS